MVGCDGVPEFEAATAMACAGDSHDEPVTLWVDLLGEPGDCMAS